MLASLLLNEPVGFDADGLRERLHFKAQTIPDAVLIKGKKAILAFIAAHQELPALKVAEGKPSLTVAEAVEVIDAKATEINDEIALLFILAALDQGT